jgi:hypothetical protein
MNEAKSNGSERRRSRRQLPKPTTEISCRSQTQIIGPDLAVAVLDISADGIRLLVNTPLEKGQRIEVDLEGIGYCRPLKLNAEVVWSLKTADGNWCLGAKF